MAIVPATGLASFDITTARRVDLSDVLAAILKQESALIGHIKVGDTAKDTTYKWPNDSLAPKTITGAEPMDVSEVDLDVTAGHQGRIRIGALILDTATGKREIMQVTDNATATLTVVRGYGSTDPETHLTGAIYRIIGSPIQENREPIKADDRWSAGPTEDDNFTQLFERSVTAGDTLKLLAANGMIAGYKDWLKQQIVKRTEELKEELADTVINGRKSVTAGSDTEYRTMAGIVEFLTEAGSLHDATPEDFTETVANNLVMSCWAKGATPSHLLVSALQLGSINTWEVDRIRVDRDDKVAGRYVTRWRSQIGMEFPIIVDRYVPPDIAGFIDVSNITLKPFGGDAWHAETMARTGRITTVQLSGQYTLQVLNNLEGHALHSLLTVPAA